MQNYCDFQIFIIFFSFHKLVILDGKFLINETSVHDFYFFNEFDFDHYQSYVKKNKIERYENCYFWPKNVA